MALFRMKPHYRKRGVPINYRGTTTPPSDPLDERVGITFKNCALFAGGRSRYNPTITTDAIDIYDASLTKTLIRLTQNRRSFAGAVTGSHVLFGGGYNSSISNSVIGSVEAFDSSFTATTTSGQLRDRVGFLAATSQSSNALFGGGMKGNSTANQYITPFDQFLTQLSYISLYKPSYALAAAKVGEFAIFAGGYSTEPLRYATAIGNGLTISYCSFYYNMLRDAVYSLTGCSVGSPRTYALFAGGYKGSGSGFSNIVTAYTPSLTVVAADNLSVPRENMCAASVDKYAIFGCGDNNSGWSKVVEAYDHALVHTILPSVNDYHTSAACTDSYVLFSGSGSTSVNTTEVYQLT